jgi:hypothetical protein
LSVVDNGIENMFDGWQGADALVRADDATVAAAIAGWARAEAAVSSRRLAASAEVSAAQGISHGMAAGQMYLAGALRDRLPRVAPFFADGAISVRLAAAIVWHTDLKDEETLRLVDAALASRIPQISSGRPVVISG